MRIVEANKLPSRHHPGLVVAFHSFFSKGLGVVGKFYLRYLTTVASTEQGSSITSPQLQTTSRFRNYGLVNSFE